LLHTFVPNAKISAELDIIVAMWNSERFACRPIEGSVVSITLWPTDVASNAQKRTLKTIVDADGESTQVALLVGDKETTQFYHK